MYTFDARIRFSETDSDGKLKYTGLLNYFQDCSTFQSEDLGLGVSFLRDKGVVWVLNYWQIDVIRYPKLCEHVTVGTFPYEFKGFIGYRNFFMKDEAGEYIAKASSIWTLLSINTGKPTRPLKEHYDLYKVEEKLDMTYFPRKIAIPEDINVLDEIEVKHQHLDTNNHVNNGQFVLMAEECLNKFRDSDTPFELKRIRAEYKKQTFLGDILIPQIGKTEDGGYVIKLVNKSDNEPACVVELS